MVLLFLFICIYIYDTIRYIINKQNRNNNKIKIKELSSLSSRRLIVDNLMTIDRHCGKKLNSHKNTHIYNIK